MRNWDQNTTGFSFVIGYTSKALQHAEIPYKQIRLDASKVKTILNKHIGMSIDTFMEIPSLLENPVVVIDSKHNDDARIIMGDLHDSNGKIVTVVLLLTPTSKKGNQLDILKVSSAQGRGHIESLFQKEDGSPVEIRYVDKKRIQDWLNANRLQSPLHSFNLDSATDSAAIDSISHPPPSVNPSDKKTPTIRESKKKQTPAEPSGTDRSTYELYQNVEQLVSSLMYEEAPGGAYFNGKLSERLKGTVWRVTSFEATRHIV